MDDNKYIVLFSVHFIEPFILFSFRNNLAVHMVLSDKVLIAPESYYFFVIFDHSAKLDSELSQRQRLIPPFLLIWCWHAYLEASI